MDIDVLSDLCHFGFKQVAIKWVTDLYVENIILYG